MNILGISAGFHDAGVSLINGSQILFAGHAERYSGKKHDHELNIKIIKDALQYGEPDVIAYYERPWLKKTRQLYAGQYDLAFDFSDINIKKYLQKTVPQFKIPEKTKFVHVPHHLSHAAAGFQTSPYDDAVVVVIDAIGEWDTVSIWDAQYDYKGKARYKKLWSKRYPNSIGLWYSAVTKLVGLRPLDEEYILMGMAAWGAPKFKEFTADYFIDNLEDLQFQDNYHAGIEAWPMKGLHEFEIAATTQSILEDILAAVMRKARTLSKSSNLVYMGGVALNCSANRNLGRYYDNIWIMPNPGDCGSSLGAAAYTYGKQLNWEHPYLGTDIPGPYPVAALIKELLQNQIAGVASGRAEFGPRALGNRSLLADPKGPDIKDRVNVIKQRQKFRPFAPVILEEHVNTYFEMPHGFTESPYMQAVARCKFPKHFPAIIHVDGTSRVQTVPRNCKSGIRQLLEQWFIMTDSPMLLNTSLNIRGEPMVNDRSDANRFEDLYHVRVWS